MSRMIVVLDEDTIAHIRNPGDTVDVIIDQGQESVTITYQQLCKLKAEIDQGWFNGEPPIYED